MSPSHINSFISYRPQWFINYCLNKRGPGNPAMFRGSSVEDGVNFFVENRDKWSDQITNTDDKLIIAAIEHARKEFTTRCQQANESPKSMIDSISSCVYHAIHHFVPLWKNEIPKMQHKISIKLPGVKTTIIGYLDYLMHDEVQDLKVSSKKPSGLTQGYGIQGAIYNYALQLPVSFHFTVPLKTKTDNYIVDLKKNEAKYYLDYAILAAQRIETIYKILEKPFIFQKRDDIAEVFAAMAFPDVSAFWNAKDKETIQEIWNIKQREPDHGFNPMPDI